jgi:hypothetical protein
LLSRPWLLTKALDNFRIGITMLALMRRKPDKC